MSGDEHTRIKGDPHSPDGKSKHGLDVLRLQDDIRRKLRLLKHFVRNGADAVALVDQQKRAAGQKGEIRVMRKLRLDLVYCTVAAVIKPIGELFCTVLA